MIHIERLEGDLIISRELPSSWFRIELRDDRS